MSLQYPYWLSALIGPREVADLYKLIGRSSEVFYYTFPKKIPNYNNISGDSKGFSQLTEKQQENFITALSYISTITAIRFEYSADPFRSNTLAIAINNQTEKNSLGYAYTPETNFIGGDIFISNHPSNETLSEGTEGALTLVHELGHALGLKHPHEEAEGMVPVSVLPREEDTVANTVMSYEETTLENFKFEFNHLDIAALQYIYGPNPNTRASDDIYEISPTQANFIWDGAGVDTIDASNLESGVTLHLTPGFHDFVGESAASIVTAPGQITVNFGTTIENVIGSAFNDALFGNAHTNVIMGNGGSDTIDGGDDVDVALYAESLSAITLSSNKEDDSVIWEITLANGDKDTLVNIERLSFNDTRVALDLDGNAGSTAKLLGAFLGGTGVSKKSFVGIGLQYLDEGGTYEELMELAISTVFGETPNSRTVISTFYENLTGQAAPESVVATYASLLDDGDLSLLSLALQAADNENNLLNIDLVGLTSTGIEYS